MPAPASEPGPRPRRRGLFRGSELSRMLLLIGLLAVGWPAALLYAWRLHSRPEPPKPAPVAATATPLPPPDDSPPFQAVRDKAPMSFDDNAAYALLLERARATPPQELAARSRRDLLFTHLWQRPGRYRGLPVHLEGTAERILSYEVNPALSPRGRLYEAWVITPDSQHNPYCLVFEDPPPGLPGGADVSERVAFDGYFLKLMSYQAGDTARAAPVLVGRLRWIPHLPTGPGSRPTLPWTLYPLAALTLYALIRWGLYTSRLLRGRPADRSPRLRRNPNDRIEPEALASWLESVPDEPDEPEPS